MSAALTLLKHVWNHRHTDSYEALNHCMYEAVSLAVGSKLNWDKTDFAYVGSNFRPGYWLGEHGWEWVYSLAIATEATSFIKAFESWKGRKPFMANHVENTETRGYNHFTNTSSKRGRIALGTNVIINGVRFECTSINNERVVLTSRSEEGKRRILKLTPEQCKTPFPTVKKPPKTRPPRGWITAGLAVQVTGCATGVRHFVNSTIRSYMESGFHVANAPRTTVGDLTGAAITIGLLRDIDAHTAERFIKYG